MPEILVVAAAVAILVITFYTWSVLTAGGER